MRPGIPSGKFHFKNKEAMKCCQTNEFELTNEQYLVQLS